MKKFTNKEKKEIKVLLADVIIARSRECGYSQYTLAKALDITAVTLNNKLSGTTSWSLAEVIALSVLLDVPFSSLAYTVYVLTSDHISTRHPEIADIIDTANNSQWNAESRMTWIANKLDTVRTANLQTESSDT